jgi:hypothetical protein
MISLFWETTSLFSGPKFSVRFLRENSAKIPIFRDMWSNADFATAQEEQSRSPSFGHEGTACRLTEDQRIPSSYCRDPAVVAVDPVAPSPTMPAAAAPPPSFAKKKTAAAARP